MSRLSPSTVWVLELELGTLDLAANTFTFIELVPQFLLLHNWSNATHLSGSL